MALPETRRPGHALDGQGVGRAVFECHTRLEAIQRRLAYFVLYLGVVGLGDFVPWVGDGSLQATVVGEYQQALAIIVETSGGIDVLRLDVISERHAPGGIRELAQDAVRLVE